MFEPGGFRRKKSWTRSKIHHKIALIASSLFRNDEGAISGVNHVALLGCRHQNPLGFVSRVWFWSPPCTSHGDRTGMCVHE